MIIGGGSSGTYAAVKVLDSNKTVMVIEKEAITGGHTNTYTDPATGSIVDYGVVVFHNNNLTRNYFARFNISLVIASLASSASEPIDFRTGKQLTNYTEVDPTAALQGSFEQLQKYPYLETGFNLTYPVPEDLLPFGDFLEKYSLGNAAQFICQFAQGLGNVLDQPTLYVFENFGTEIIEDLSLGFLTTANQDNSQLYQASAAELLSKNSLLLSSTITAIALITTPYGPKVIIAKQVLLTIPPRASLLKDLFDLSPTEQDLFSQFNNSA